MGKPPRSKPDPAIAWLATLAAPESPTEYLLAQASSLLVRSGQTQPPFDPFRALPVSIKRIELAALTRDGLLLTTEDGFIIKINSQRPVTRQRFACAHEIGHTFFYDLSGMRPWRPPDSTASYWAEESLCYQFAEEMLMPCMHIKRMAGSLSPCLNNLLRIRDTFGVSTEALCRRIARLNLWHCILLIFAFDQSSSALAVKTVCRHESYKNLTLRRDTLLAKDSSVYAALEDPGVVKFSTLEGPRLFRKGGQRTQWRIESVCVPKSVLGRVVTMVTVIGSEPEAHI